MKGVMICTRLKFVGRQATTLMIANVNFVSISMNVVAILVTMKTMTSNEKSPCQTVRGFLMLIS
ncbi:MAG: hypothetical protein K2K02_01005 [Ruminococcus sp.]|nr:hypothetical protein [Ruminococcus sp.]